MTIKRKKTYSGRDYHMVGIIAGANKAYVEKDLKKEANKKTSRAKVTPEDERDKEELCCKQCAFPYHRHPSRNKDERAAQECGYCSVSCMDYATSDE